MLPLRKQIRLNHHRSASSTCSSCTSCTPTAREHGPRTTGSSGSTCRSTSSPPCTTAPPPPPPPLPAVPAAPAPPAFALGPGHSHAVLNFNDPNTDATATKLYNKAISPLEGKFDGKADNLAFFLTSVRDRARHFNWHRLITMPIDDGTTRNLLTHYGQVSVDNTRTHAMTYINMPTRDAQDNDMFY